MQKFVPIPPQPQRRALSIGRLIDAYNPGVTMLVLIWTVAFSVRRYLLSRGALSQTGWEALTSLIYVVPIMLVGWATLAVFDRMFRLGIFRRDDD
jgi:hypothetical protein